MEIWTLLAPSNSVPRNNVLGARRSGDTRAVIAYGVRLASSTSVSLAERLMACIGLLA
jgi:hypothetical protein